MIIATAGHVDHGKSALTRLITGVDPDRLAEEKARGLSIDLGFAYTPLPGGGMLGVVDVPGHEQFIANMLAGVAAVDRAMLVVAADDGVMPQTLEHLAILDLLGIPGGVIVVTKVDRADKARLDAVKDEIRSHVAATAFADAPLFCVSNITGEGVDALRAHLFELAATIAKRKRAGHFRLAIDRRFIMKGSGLVVTGSAFSGKAAAGDRLVLGTGAYPARVRAIHAQNTPANEGGAGERLALNLAGPDLDKDRTRRGDWLAAPEACHPTSRIDARLSVLATQERPLAHDSRVHFHFGALDSPARIAVLKGRKIEPGQSGLVQIILDRPTIAANGDRFVIRDHSARHTIAGGVVLDPFGPARGRARPGRIETLEILNTGDPAAAFSSLLEKAEGGVDLAWFARVMNLTDEEAQALWGKVPLVRAGDAAAPVALAEPRWAALLETIMGAIEKKLGEDPAAAGVSASAVLQDLPRGVSPALLSSALADLVRAGRLHGEGQLYHKPGAAKREPPVRNVMGDKILGALRDSGVPPATVNQIAEQTGLAVKLIVGFLNRAANEGLVRRVSDTRFFLPETVAALAQEAEALAAMQDGVFKAADFRDRTGMGRNPSIEILEYFDKTGFTRRRGDDRVIAKAAADVFSSR